MRNAWVSALVAGLFIAGCGDDVATGGSGGTGASTQGGGNEGGSENGGNPTNGGGGATSDGGGGSTTTTCGDGVLDAGEGCDDGNTANSDGCDDACAVEPGFECRGEPSDCFSVCGDGIVIAGSEDCDDGNTTGADGCDGNCAIETGYLCTGEPSVCATDCGDGLVAGDEECDDANDVSQDGCDMLCVVENGYDCVGEPSDCTATCGDGVIAIGKETCDDGNTAGADGCDIDCAIESGFSCQGEPSVCMTACGDGVVAGTEECDDANNLDNDGCSAACAEESGFDCTGNPSVCTTTCGDGITAGTETCDDSNAVGGDCCSASCLAEAGCETEPNNTDATADDFAAHQVGGVVNGFVNPSGDSNHYSVTLTVPGSISAETLDGILGSQCALNEVDSRIRIFDSTGTQIAVDDDGGAGFCSHATTGLLAAGTYFVVVDASPFDPTATFDYAVEVIVNDAVCGDGDVDPNETCDDGNTTSGDGCDSTCQVECNSESEPNDMFGVADALQVPGNNNCGSINPAADIDFWTFTITAVSDVRIETFDATGTGCVANDTFIDLRSSDGTTVLVTDDDDGINNCSLIAPANDVAARHLAPGTYYVRIIDFGQNNVIPAYRVGVTFPAVCGNGITEGFEECDGGATCTATCDRIPVCGDTFIDAPEQCDDGNTASGDGCSSTCQVEVQCIAGATFNESEPNDDGTVAVATNDFSAAGADGTVCADLLINAAITPAGDDDVYAVTNQTAAPLSVSFETGAPTIGVCATADTQIRIRDASGAQLAFDDDTGPGFCSLLTFIIPPLTTVYAHVIEFGDNGTIAAYQLNINYP